VCFENVIVGRHRRRALRRCVVFVVALILVKNVNAERPYIPELDGPIVHEQEIDTGPRSGSNYLNYPGPPEGPPCAAPDDRNLPYPDSAPLDDYPSTYSPWLTRLGFRHSYTHGRNVGWGGPLVGTSWLNRPYYIGAQLGPIWMTHSVANSISTDTDLVGGLFVGCDWDYYWGNEVQINYATPELINGNAPDAERGDRLMNLNYNAMYYPWGDATFRPYWRLGVGLTEFDYPTDAGNRYDETVLTFPIGFGLKYPFGPNCAGRAEFTDYYSPAHSGIDVQHNLTLVFGLECRFGAHPKSYWPWNPSNHLW